MVGVADVTTACNAAPEILVASTGAGLGVEDMQAGGEFTKDISLMAVGGDRTSSYNLPLASLCVWPGTLPGKNPSVCSVAPSGVVPSIVFAGLGNFTSGAGRNPSLTYPVDSVLLLLKEEINAAGEYRASYDVQFVSSSYTSLSLVTKSACIAAN